MHYIYFENESLYCTIKSELGIYNPMNKRGRQGTIWLGRKELGDADFSPARKRGGLYLAAGYNAHWEHKRGTCLKN